MIPLWDLWERAKTGPQISEREFDLKLFKTVRSLVKTYDITYDAETIISNDITKSVLDAALQLIVELGVFYIDGQRIIKVEEDEVKESLKNIPREIYVGEDKERIKLTVRNNRKVNVTGGSAGCPLSEKFYSKIMYSYAKEPRVSILGTGILENYNGMTIEPGSPVDMAAARTEAKLAREAAKMAGRPGLCIIGPSHIKSEATNFASEALRTSDIYEIGQFNELKVNLETFKQILFCKTNGFVTAVSQCPLIGGYAGGPEGAAIVSVAEALQCFTISGGMFYDFSPVNIRLSVSTDRKSLWVQSVALMSLRRIKAITGTFIYTAAGPCTEDQCYEIAAQTLTNTICGAVIIGGIGGAKGKHVDHYTGMEARIVGEVSDASLKLHASDGNEILNEILKKYEEKQKHGKINIGKSFPECYDLKTITPSQEYLNIWEKVKRELENLGLSKL